MSKWEANTLVELVNELLDANRQKIKDFQTVCHCVSSKEPAGKPIEECELVRVILTTWEDEDKNDLPYKNKAASIQMRWRGIMRMTDETREQGGLLSQLLALGSREYCVVELRPLARTLQQSCTRCRSAGVCHLGLLLKISLLTFL